MIGQTISHYQILDQLGAGGMGVVYLARDTKLGRQVALKFLSPDTAQNEQARARFIHEAQAAGALDHPNIGTIHEIGEWEQQLFIAMACYEGQTLKQRIERGPLEFTEVESILSQIANGLSAAHAAGIVHRDLKPANVMLTSSGQVKILDFGLAKLIQTGEDAETRLTATGVVIGTIAYMSPEQAQGEDVDHRSDLWSLGVMAYEMLSGVLPFRAGSKIDTFNRILTTEPKPLGEMRASVPLPLRQIVGQLLQKKAEARMQSAGEVLQALSRKSESVESRTSERVTLPPLAERQAEDQTRPLLRNWRWRIAIGLAIAAVIVAGYFFWSKRGGIPAAEAASVVALPAQVLGAQELGFLTDAIPSTLSTQLGQVEGLETKVPPTSIEFESIHRNLGKIADLYGVKTCVVSTITATDANHFVLNVQLVEPRSGRILWSQQYEGQRGSYLELARQAADGIRQKLRPATASVTSGGGAAATSEAELSFRQGQHYFNRYNYLHQPGDFDLAFSALKRALDLDPKLADAAAEIAFLYRFKWEGDAATTQETIPEMETWANRALAINPRCSKGWAALVWMELIHPAPNLRKLLDASLKAVSFGPQDSFAHTTIGAALEVASFELSLPSSLESRRLDPLYLHASLNASLPLRRLGRPAEALALDEEVLKIESDMPRALGVRLLNLLALGRVNEAAELVKRLEELAAKNRYSAGALLTPHYILAVERKDTRAVETALGSILKIANDPQTPGAILRGTSLDLAPYLARYGKTDLALQFMTRSTEAGRILPYDWLMLSPDLASLRADARFNNIAARSRAQFDEMLKILEEARGRGEFPKYLEAPLADLLKKLGIKP